MAVILNDKIDTKLSFFTLNKFKISLLKVLTLYMNDLLLELFFYDTVHQCYFKNIQIKSL